MSNSENSMHTHEFFVRGLSRSGGTLMATILDAHPDVAMSYETYEHLLATDKQVDHRLSDIVGKTQETSLEAIRSLVFGGSKEKDSNFKKFVARAERAGVGKELLAELFIQHFDAGLEMNNFRERMLFVERLTKEKARQEGKRFWGAKVLSVYRQLDDVYPHARYLFMLRDGRDIAASRKFVGRFDQSVEHVAESWCSQIEKFERFADASEGRAIFVTYERFVFEPEQQLQGLMKKLELSWSDQLLTSHEMDLSIHRNPMGHLSGKQVGSPINGASIGRWKIDLTADEVSRFEKIAGEMLEKLGYR